MQDGGARATQRSWTVYLQTGKEKKRSILRSGKEPTQRRKNRLHTAISVTHKDLSKVFVKAVLKVLVANILRKTEQAGKLL